MIRSIGIYLYAALLVIGTVFKLSKIKRQLKQHPEIITDEEVFVVPNVVAKKVIIKTGTKVHVKGKENIPQEAVLFVSNHQGIFDILAFLGYIGKPVGFIAKKEIKKLPIVRTWMELVHCVFIDRQDRRQSMRAIQKGIKHLKNGHSMVVFPEGTRGNGREINEFKPGSFRLGTKANVPIVPVTIDGTYQIFEKGRGRIEPSTIKLIIHEPILPEQYKKLKNVELAAMVQEVIEKSMPSFKEQEEGREEKTLVEQEVNA